MRPTSTRLLARQSGAPAAKAEVEKKRGRGGCSGGERCQSESRAEPLLHSEPTAFRLGEVQATSIRIPCQSGK